MAYNLQDQDQSNFWSKLLRNIAIITSLGACGGLAFSLAKSSNENVYIPLEERLEQSYQVCQMVDDKDIKRNNLLISFNGAYVTCREVEKLYHKVKQAEDNQYSL